MHRYTGRPSIPQVLRRAVLVGLSAGLRSATPIGVMAAERNGASFRAGWKDWPLFRSSAGRTALQASWAGELMFDKSPIVPPRTDPKVLGGRMMIGAIAGMAMGTERKGAGPKVAGMLAGTAAAVAGNYGGYAYRTRVAKLTGLPDLPLALAEDVVAFALARKGIKG